MIQFNQQWHHAQAHSSGSRDRYFSYLIYEETKLQKGSTHGVRSQRQMDWDSFKLSPETGQVLGLGVTW